MNLRTVYMPFNRKEFCSKLSLTLSTGFFFLVMNCNIERCEKEHSICRIKGTEMFSIFAILNINFTITSVFKLIMQIKLIHISNFLNTCNAINGKISCRHISRGKIHYFVAIFLRWVFKYFKRKQGSEKNSREKKHLILVRKKSPKEKRPHGNKRLINY